MQIEIVKPLPEFMYSPTEGFRIKTFGGRAGHALLADLVEVAEIRYFCSLDDITAKEDVDLLNHIETVPLKPQ